eukprot:m51a1_g9861 putative C-tail anchored domain, protein kinase domain (346) ;mRNA; r:1993165-1995034
MQAEAGEAGEAAAAGQLRRLGAGQPISALYSYDAHTDLLGQGSVGEVFRATKVADGSVWALKAVRPGPAGEAQLRRSVGCWSRLHHRNIAQLHEALVAADGTAFLVMELCQGGSLAERLGGCSGRSRERLARNITCELASAIDHMHAQGVVHRDIKLDNVLLADAHGDSVKIIDFDDACFADSVEDLTQYVGTSCYLAPEVLRCEMADTRAPYGKECDLWSLGATVFALLRGCPPFKEPTPTDNSWKEDTLNATLRFDGVVWRSVSQLIDTTAQEARELIRHLIVANVRERMTAQQVKSHHWFTDFDKDGSDHTAYVTWVKLLMLFGVLYAIILSALRKVPITFS